VGFSFGELVVLAILALIVIGPKDLPKLLRSAGRVIGTVKRTVADVRRETGLDEVLRGDFRDLERLADHIERLDAPAKEEPEQLSLPNIEDQKARREREYPRIGADAHGLLPEDAPVYGDLAAPPHEAASAAEPEAPQIVAAEGAIASSDPFGQAQIELPSAEAKVEAKAEAQVDGERETPEVRPA
jgi:sec-independent protein translocase protein TatB